MSNEKGYTYIWMMFAVALAGVALAGGGQAWKTEARREKEKELLFIGEQFRLAIGSYYDQSPGAKRYPESLEKLISDNRFPTVTRHLRKIFHDPMTGAAEWGLITQTRRRGYWGAQSVGPETAQEGKFSRALHVVLGRRHLSRMEVYISPGRGRRGGLATSAPVPAGFPFRSKTGWSNTIRSRAPGATRLISLPRFPQSIRPIGRKRLLPLPRFPQLIQRNRLVSFFGFPQATQRNRLFSLFGFQ